MVTVTKRAIHEPRIGRSKKNIAASTMASAPTCDRTRYGTVLPAMNDAVEIGAMRTCSIVPRSFSRTIDRAVEMTAVIIEMNAMSPGTRNTVLLSSGLYQTRGTTVMGAAAGGPA